MSTQQAPLSLHRLTFVSPLNQDLVAEYLTHLRARHSRPKTLQTTLGALVTFYRLLPPARQPSLWQDVTRLTPADVDAWGLYLAAAGKYLRLTRRPIVGTKRYR